MAAFVIGATNFLGMAVFFFIMYVRAAEAERGVRDRSAVLVAALASTQLCAAPFALVGVALGLAAILAGDKRTELATIGIVLNLIPIALFVAFMVIAP